MFHTGSFPNGFAEHQADSSREAWEELKGGKNAERTLVGVLLMVLGLASFVRPSPASENHGLQIGDAKIGVQTNTRAPARRL